MYLFKFNTPIAYLLISFFFLLFSSSSAYNINEILSKYPDFSIFNDYLTKSRVANPINEHRIMTVLVVNNAAMSSFIAGKSMDVINKVMHVHAFLDYYPLNKFKGLPTLQTTQVTTLLQSPDQQRYLNITNGATVSIVSAAGSDKAQVVRQIDASDSSMTAVVEITNVIVPSSISSSPTTTPSTPAPSLPPSNPSPSSPTPSSTPTCPFACPSNITRVLNNYPEYNTFNTYLIETQVSNQINARSTFTLLVVNNAAMNSLAGKPTEQKKKVLSLHVLMDYYTSETLHSLPTSQPTQLTTLLQASFQSTGFQGLLNATNGDTVTIVFASGSNKANLVRDVFTWNSRVSVVEVSSLIVPSDSTPSPSSPSPSGPSPSVPSPTPSPTSKSFNITEVLSKYPDFSTFNDYLTRTLVCNQINERRILTILVANNEAMSSLVGKPMDVIRKVLSIQVVLDYYTVQNLRNLPALLSTRLNTLLEVTEHPSGQQGFVNVTNGDTISIVSADGSNQAVVVRELAADEGSTISVVQISKVIVPSTLTSPTTSPSPPVASPSNPSPSSPLPTASSSPSPSSSPFDITNILSGNPDFNLFNTYLTQTQVANQIMERKTMTVFVVNNGAMTSLVDKPMEIKKKVLSLHVMMDYYTVAKFHNLPVGQSTRINTLLEITDQPSGQQGFLNVTNGDTISIVSAAGSDQTVVVRDVASDERSYISLVQISNIILPSSLIAPTPPPSSNPVTSRAAAPVEAPSSNIASAPMGNAPLPIAPISDAPKAEAPKVDTPKADAPKSDAPTPDSPKSDSPIASLLAPSPSGISLSPLGVASSPLPSGTRAMSCASLLTIILASTLSLASLILI